jgi:hypothetical protein
MADAESVPVPFFKKAKRRPGASTARVKPIESSPPPGSSTLGGDSTGQEDAIAKSEVVRPTQRVKPKILSQGTKRKRDDSALDDDPSTNRGASDMAVGVNYTSSYGASDSLADLQAQEHAEFLALKAKKARLDAGETLSDIDGTGSGLNDGLYHGEKAYGNVLGKRDETAKPRAQRIGPQRNMNSTIRTVTMIDYQPDVCKDYKGGVVIIPLREQTTDRLCCAQKLDTAASVIHANSCTIEGHTYRAGNSIRLHHQVQILSHLPHERDCISLKTQTRTTVTIQTRTRKSRLPASSVENRTRTP